MTQFKRNGKVDHLKIYSQMFISNICSRLTLENPECPSIWKCINKLWNMDTMETIYSYKKKGMTDMCSKMNEPQKHAE